MGKNKAATEPVKSKKKAKKAEPEPEPEEESEEESSDDSDEEVKVSFGFATLTLFSAIELQTARRRQLLCFGGNTATRRPQCTLYYCNALHAPGYLFIWASLLAEAPIR